ncbi:hypothetical protein CRUP_032251 [Coryphaenoides rupestris]|nr:hypothetical protein CRUP_032251 [Coryphaenoides rupestris]
MLAFESDMERAFAAQLSQDKVCSICMEVVVQKTNPSERRFGILSSCCHTYCLACIRQWRCAKQFDNKIINKKACKYFDQGRGSCPFGGKCLYLHAYQDGTRAEADKPRKQLGDRRKVGKRYHGDPPHQVTFNSEEEEEDDGIIPPVGGGEE